MTISTFSVDLPKVPFLPPVAGAAISSICFSTRSDSRLSSSVA